MMDISDATKGPVVEGGGGVRKGFEPKPSEAGEEAVDDDKEMCPKNLKRSSGEDSMNSKKRRKQLKPIRIATNLEAMVKVPKQIIGLNNDLDIVNDLSHTVPKELSSNSQNSPLVNDVHYPRPLQSESPAGAAANDSGLAIDGPRPIDKPDKPDFNVPSIDMGPNYPHFLFPLSFQPVKNPNFWSEANLKIFNQEAYCELCKKEFCNKYFLKTHKANKHGIYVDIPPSFAGKAKAESKDALKVAENGREGDCATAYCDLCNKKFCNKYFVRRHKSKSHGLVDDDAQIPGFPCNDPESKIVQSSPLNSTKETNSTLTARPLALVSKDNDFDPDNQKQEKATGGEGEEEGPLNLIVNAKEDSDFDEERDNDKTEEVAEKSEGEGDDCSSENIEKLQTMLLRLNPSEIESKACRVCNDAVDGSGEHKCAPDKRDKDYLSDANDSSNESKNEFGGLKPENPDFAFVNRLEHLKQMKPTSSYCEICNKELCNKYFMRTHMQRMHGIEIEHGTQIGGVVCNICNKELCSKYFLRVHKQNTHGIASPNSLLAPSTSGGAPAQKPESKAPRADPRFASNFSQVCYICNKRFRSSKWLQAHFLSDHREESGKMEAKEPEDADQKEQDFNPTLKIPKKNADPDDAPEALDVISKIFWENSSASKTYNCSQCPFTTSVLAFLFVHERSHLFLAQDQPETIKPSVSLQNLIHDKTFWQHKITQQIPECLDLSAAKPKYVTFEQNGS